METNPMQKLDGIQNLEVPFLPLVQFRLVHHAVGLFYVPDLFRRKRGVYHILRQPDQSLPIFFLYDDFIMNRKTGMMPVSHIFHQAVADAIVFLHHGKDLFTKYDSCLVTVNSRKRMKTSSKVKHAVGNQAVNVRMPDQQLEPLTGLPTNSGPAPSPRRCGFVFRFGTGRRRR